MEQHVAPEIANKVAERLFSAIESGNVDAIRALYSPEIGVWHNTDGKIQTRDENLATLGWVIKNIKNIRYTDVRRSPTQYGFVQQHVLRGLSPSGKEFALPACLVATIRGEHIVRIDEYLDSAHTAALR